MKPVTRRLRAQIIMSYDRAYVYGRWEFKSMAGDKRLWNIKKREKVIIAGGLSTYH